MFDVVELCSNRSGERSRCDHLFVAGVAIAQSEHRGPRLARNILRARHSWSWRERISSYVYVRAARHHAHTCDSVRHHLYG